MTDAPKRPADRRPDDEPYFLDYTECPDCGTGLVYYHELDDEQLRASDELVDPIHADDGANFYDEFVCPECCAGVHMDWPDAEWDKLTDRADEMEDES